MMRGFVLLSLALLVAACEPSNNGAGDGAASDAIRPVITTVLSNEGGGGQIFTGIVEPRVETTLAFQVLGQLVARDVKTGDLVSRGQLVAAIDPTTFELNVRSAEAAVRNAVAERDNADASAQRIAALRRSGTAPEASWDMVRAVRDAAIAKARQAEAALVKARDLLGYARLVAEFDGVVTATGAEVGQTVSAGQMVVTIARPDLRDAVIDVPDWMADEVSPGTRLGLSLEIAPTITALGQVREVAPQSDAMTRTRRVKIALDDPSNMFRLGSTVRASFVGGDRLLLTAPESAILSRDGGNFVWVVTPDPDTAASDRPLGTVATRKVTIGADGEGMVALLGGVKPGERIVTAGVHSLDEGERVALHGELR